MKLRASVEGPETVKMSPPETQALGPYYAPFKRPSKVGKLTQATH